MPNVIDGTLGVGLFVNQIVRAGELAPKQVPLGTVRKGDDGHDVIWAQASGAIAQNVATILTESTMTMATGAGAWTSPLTLPAPLAAGDRTWFRKTAI